MSIGSSWKSGSWGNPSWKTGSWANLGLADFTLVDSPTRLVKMRRVTKVGDTVPITETLKGSDGSAQDLPSGSSVVFNLKGPAGNLLIDRQAVSIRQIGSGDAATNKGGVAVTIAASADLPEGICTFEFEATFPDGSVLTFPDDTNGELTVIPQLA